MQLVMIGGLRSFAKGDWGGYAAFQKIDGVDAIYADCRRYDRLAELTVKNLLRWHCWSPVLLAFYAVSRSTATRFCGLLSALFSCIEKGDHLWVCHWVSYVITASRFFIFSDLSRNLERYDLAFLVTIFHISNYSQ